MAIPLSIILSAAPGIVSAATDIMRLIKQPKQDENAQGPAEIARLESIIEKQAKLIEDLALNNKYLVQAVKTNRIVAIVSSVLAATACLLAVFL